MIHVNPKTIAKRGGKKGFCDNTWWWDIVHNKEPTKTGQSNRVVICGWIFTVYIWNSFTWHHRLGMTEKGQRLTKILKKNNKSKAPEQSDLIGESKLKLLVFKFVNKYYKKLIEIC